jgi:hypothetical protein
VGPSGEDAHAHGVADIGGVIRADASHPGRATGPFEVQKKLAAQGFSP